MRRILGIFAFVGLAYALTGCGRVTAMSTVQKDGSFERRIVFTSPEEKSDPNGATITMGPKAEEMFQMPSGNGWKVSKSTAGGNTTRTAVRNIAAGEKAEDDLKVLTKGVSQLKNEASIRPLGDGTFEYLERLTWSGPKDKSGFQSGELRAVLKKHLPKDLQDSESLDKMTALIGTSAIKVLLGPSDPLIGLLMIHPDLAERRLRSRLAGAVVSSIGTVYGSKVVMADREKIARGMLSDTFAKDGLGMKKKVEEATNEGPGGNSAPLPLLMVVRVPGKIIATNGEVDLTTGEVYWGLFPEAASLAPLEMRVRYRP